MDGDILLGPEEIEAEGWKAYEVWEKKHLPTYNNCAGDERHVACTKFVEAWLCRAQVAKVEAWLLRVSYWEDRQHLIVSRQTIEALRAAAGMEGGSDV